MALERCTSKMAISTKALFATISLTVGVSIVGWMAAVMRVILTMESGRGSDR